ncbi:MAG: hypothetical protein AAGJ52_07860 [Pseudomonadota bacterium]
MFDEYFIYLKVKGFRRSDCGPHGLEGVPVMKVFPLLVLLLLFASTSRAELIEYQTELRVMPDAAIPYEMNPPGEWSGTLNATWDTTSQVFTEFTLALTGPWPVQTQFGDPFVFIYPGWNYVGGVDISGFDARLTPPHTMVPLAGPCCGMFFDSTNGRTVVFRLDGWDLTPAYGEPNWWPTVFHDELDQGYFSVQVRNLGIASCSGCTTTGDPINDGSLVLVADFGWIMRDRFEALKPN